MIRIRGEIPPAISISDYPTLVNLYWRVANESDNGMPSSDELDQMLLLDDLLNEIDGEEFGFMMFSVTGNHRKEWIWYIKDEDKFLDSLNTHLACKPRFPIEIETAPAGEWDSYNEIMSSIGGC